MKFTSTLLFFLIFYTFPLIAQKPEAVKEYNAGLEYYKLKNYEAAIPFMKEAIKKDPNFYYAYRTLIACYEAKGDVKEAIVWYEKCILIAPSDKGLVFNLAQTYIAQKNYEKAVIWLKKAVDIDPTYEKAAKSLSEVEDYLAKKKARDNPEVINENEQGGDDNSTVNRIYNEALKEYRNGNYAEAVAILKSIDEEVTNPNFFYLLAISFQQLGERAEAKAAYESTLEVDDRHFDANLNLGTLFYNDKRFDEAIPLLETAYERRKNDRKILSSLARAHYYNGEFKKAVTLFENYTLIVTDDSEAYLLLSKSYEKTGDKRKADLAFQKAKVLGGNSELADELNSSIAEYGNKAGELAKSGNYQKAIEVLEEAITKHSEQASLHFNLGLNYMEVGNVKKAQEEFAKTIELDPAHAKAYQGLGLIYYEKGEFSQAAAYYLATVQAGKQDAYVYYKLGSCHFYLNRFNDAIDAYEDAIKLKQDEKQFYFGLGLACLKNRNNTKSIRAMEQALELDQMFHDAHYHICINYIEMNQFEKAIEEGKKILKKNDNYAKAYLVIAHGYKRLGNLAEADRYKQIAVRLDPSLRD